MRWSIKGFGSFGYTGTDTDKVGFLRSSTQTQGVRKSGGITTDSRLGLQANVDINNSLHVTIQWVARDHSGNFFEQNLDWAFLRWDFNSTSNIRVGRLGVDVFLLSDYRDVGYAYPWMRPPHEFYSKLVTSHFDGFDINHKIHIDDDLLSIKIFAGYSFNQVPSNFPELVSLGSTLVGGSLKLESGNWTNRVGYAYLHLLNEVPNEQLVNVLNDPTVNFAMPGINQVIPHLSLKGTSLHYYSLGSAYDNGSWIAQAELSYMDAETVFFPDTINAYLSVGKRIEKFTVYSLFGMSHSFQKEINIPDPVFPSPQLQQLHHATDRVINKNGTDEKSVSLGIRWDFHPNVAFKTQWSHYWLGANGSKLWQDSTLRDKSRQVNVWSFGVDFTF
jgi:hypothetical protein